jgi:hypothetical protein
MKPDFQKLRPGRAARLRSPALVSLLILALGWCGVGCATSNWLERWEKPSEETPLPVVALMVSDLAADLARTDFDDFERRSLTRLSQLADIFYQRLAHRRVNSIATFHDPALREFFQSEEAFADYYADLVQDLGDEHFRANRPQQIDLLSLHVEPGADRAVAIVKFRGDNALPLRFWSVDYSRRDVWELSQDRWWIVPGKI